MLVVRCLGIIGLLLIPGCDRTAITEPVPPSAFTFCHAPSWLAVQFDDGPWVYGELNGSRVEVPEGVERLTIASRLGDVLRVHSLTVDELPTGECSASENSVYNPAVGVSVQGVQSGDNWSVSAGGAIAIGTGSGAGQMHGFPANQPDVFATVRTPQINVVRGVIVRRGVASLAPFDFAGAEARAPVFAEISVDNADGAPSRQWFHHPRGIHSLIPQGAATTRYYGIPGDLLRPSEYHVFEVQDVFDLRGIRYYYVQPNDTSITMGPEIAAHTQTAVATEPCFLPRVDLPAQAEYWSFATARFNAFYGGNHFTYLEYTATAAFLGGTPATWHLQVPRVVINGADVCLMPENPQTWSAWVGAAEGRLALVLGFPGDRETLRWAGF